MGKPNRKRLRKKRHRQKKKRTVSMQEALAAYRLNFYSDFSWMYNSKEPYWS